MFRKGMENICKFLMVIAAIWAFVLSFYILLDVVLRNMDMPIQGTSEIVTNSIVVVVFLQLAYGVHLRAMIRADFLMKFIGPGLQRWFNLFGYIVAAVFFLSVVYGTYPGAIEAWVTGQFEGEGALRVPTWPARFAVVAGCFLAGINYILLAITELVDPPVAAGPSPAH